MPLIRTANLPDPDGVYEKLIRAHDGLSDDQSFQLNARLILVLINHIGDGDVINEAIDVASRDAGD